MANEQFTQTIEGTNIVVDANIEQAKTPHIEIVELVSKTNVYVFTLPAGTRKFAWYMDNVGSGDALRFAYGDDLSGDYASLVYRECWGEDNVYLDTAQNVAFQCTTSDNIMLIVTYWT